MKRAKQLKSQAAVPSAVRCRSPIEYGRTQLGTVNAALGEGVMSGLALRARRVRLVFAVAGTSLTVLLLLWLI